MCILNNIDMKHKEWLKYCYTNKQNKHTGWAAGRRKNIKYYFVKEK